jgi:hypothetical protein
MLRPTLGALWLNDGIDRAPLKPPNEWPPLNE